MCYDYGVIERGEHIGIVGENGNAAVMMTLSEYTRTTKKVVDKTLQI
jgi:hypothetical protein